MAATATSSSLGREAFPVWGGHAVVLVREPAALEDAVGEVKRTIMEFDCACSSFRADSELALLNARAGEEVVVSGLLFVALREALSAAQVTDGAVDPTVGTALVAHRINPTLQERRPFRIEAVAGHALVQLDATASSVRMPAGVQLDLGATAKALAADMSVAAAGEAAGCGVLVALCGDIAVGGEPPEGGWTIRVTDDHRDGEAPGQTVAIQSGGLATSSMTVRRSGQGSAAMHHLIDPQNGLPAAGPWRTASVSARSCLHANVASTAAIVMGARAPEWLEVNGFPARLVGQDSSVRHLAGWPQDGDDL